MQSPHRHRDRLLRADLRPALGRARLGRPDGRHHLRQRRHGPRRRRPARPDDRPSATASTRTRRCPTRRSAPVTVDVATMYNDERYRPRLLRGCSAGRCCSATALEASRGMTSTYASPPVACRVWGLLVAVVLVVVMTALAEPFDPDSVGPGQDARAYWAAPLDAPYVPGSVGPRERVPLFAGVPRGLEPAAGPPLAPVRGGLDGPAAGGPLLARRTAPLPAAPRAGAAGDLGRQHHHPPRGRDRRRALPTGRMGLAAADEGDARRRAAVVRRSAASGRSSPSRSWPPPRSSG